MSLYTDGFLQDAIDLNSDSLTDTCILYQSIDGNDGQGGVAETFANPILVQFKLDDEVNALLPERERTNIEAQKIQRTGYIPLGTRVKIKDKLVSNAGQPDDSVISYRILDITEETDELDLALWMEVMT